MKLDDEIIEVEALDVIRVSPEVVRGFEAGHDGFEVLAFGAHMTATAKSSRTGGASSP